MLYDDFTIFLYLKKLSQLNLEANTCDEYEEDFDDTFDGWETYRMNHSVRARINRRNLFLQLSALEGNVYVLECCEFFSELSLYPKPSLKIGSVNKAFLF